MSKVDDDEIDELINHKPGQSRPPKYEPYEMYHGNPQDGWDRWENERYEFHLPGCILEWNRRISFAHRTLKLYNKRLINPLYCKKSPRNYTSYCKYIKPYYIYIGTKYK